MAEYKTIYPFEVFDSIKDGKKVYMLDREKEAVWLVNTMKVEAVTEVLAKSGKAKNRFEFWVRTVTKNEAV